SLNWPMNFGHAATFGMETIATFNPTSFWSANFSFSAFQTRIEDHEGVEDIARNQTSWYTKLINNFSLGRNSKLQVLANYTSPVAVPQGSTIEIYNVDAGFQQSILKGQGKLGISITDIFNTQRSGLITSAYNFEATRTG